MYLLLFCLHDCTFNQKLMVFIKTQDCLESSYFRICLMAIFFYVVIGFQFVIKMKTKELFEFWTFNGFTKPCLKTKRDFFLICVVRGKWHLLWLAFIWLFSNHYKSSLVPLHKIKLFIKDFFSKCEQDTKCHLAQRRAMYPLYKNQSFDLFANQLTGFYKRGVMFFNEVIRGCDSFVVLLGGRSVVTVNSLVNLTRRQASLLKK